MTPLDPLPPDDDPFALLGVDPTDPDLDARALKRAYTRLIKRYKPERDPVAFRRIRQAYESALDRLGLNVVPGLPPVVVNSLRSQRPPDGGLPSREPGPRPFAHPARAADELRAELLEQVDAGRFDAAFERAAAEAAKWKRAGWIAVHDVCLQLAAALAWQAPTGADRLFERLETWVGVAPEAAGRIEDYRERRRLRPAWTRSRTRVATTPALDRLLQLAPLLGTDALRRARDDARAEAAGAPARTLAALDALHRAQPALLGQLHESIARALPPRRPLSPDDRSQLTAGLRRVDRTVLLPQAGITCLAFATVVAVLCLAGAAAWPRGLISIVVAGPVALAAVFRDKGLYRRCARVAFAALACESGISVEEIQVALEASRPLRPGLTPFAKNVREDAPLHAISWLTARALRPNWPR